MIANVQMSSDIAHSLTYGQDRCKGGEVFMGNYLDLTKAPREQAKDWEAMSNGYSVKCINIVLSFSSGDTRILREKMAMADRVGVEKGIVKAFLDELVARGNDNLYECPFVVAHHGNTDNEHFHVTILTTTATDGRRFNDRFIKKNACRAAAKVSEMYGLECAKKALEREKAHQVHVSKVKGERRRSRPYEDNPEKVASRMERAKAVERAKMRKAELKYRVEAIARRSSAGDFKVNLIRDGLSPIIMGGKGMGVCAFLDGKERSYSFLDLGIDMELVPMAKPDSPHPNSHNDVIRQRSKRNTAKPAAHAGKRNSLHKTVTGDAGGGSPSDRVSQRGDVNPDGSLNHGSDEEWRRRGGYSY